MPGAVVHRRSGGPYAVDHRPVVVRDGKALGIAMAVAWARTRDHPGGHGVPSSDLRQRLGSALLIQLVDLMMRGVLVCSVLVPGPCFVLE